MNENTNTAPVWTLSNILAVIGFIVLVVLLSWLAIQFVRLIPSAFSSLARVFNENQQDLRDRVINDNPVVVVDDSKKEEEQDAAREEAAESEEDKETTTETEVTNEVEEVVSTPTPTPAKTTKPVTQYKTVTTYKVPVSDPNGKTDLQVTFVAFGQMTANERFLPGTTIEEGELAAMQFKVQNIGTKTSSDWRFEADLPTGGTMKSPAQLPLKPGEISTLTISFVPTKEGVRNAGVIVSGGNDVNLNNNAFKTTVRVK